jgi:digeranylgeranylglycerophospholipid reductase
LKRENGNWKLQTSQGEVESRIVMDASGPAAFTSRKLGLNPSVKTDLPFETITGMQYELKEIPRNGYLDFFLWPRLAESGYLWMIPKSDGRANVGLVTTRVPEAKTNLDQFLKEMDWEQKTKVKTFGGPIPHSGPVPHTHADGLLLVGDAAGFTSPLFEGGTQLGLRSGQFAARVAEQAIRKNNCSKESLAEYEKMWKNEFPKYERLIKGKKALYGFSDSELNEIASILPKELGNLKPTDKAMVGVKILTGHRNLLQKGVIDAFLAFAYSRAEYYGW